MPIHIEDIPALGIRWLGHLYFDCTLPMGSRTVCALFERLSTALEFIVHEHGCDLLCHMLDDFLLVTLGSGEAQTNLDTFLWICEELGIAIAVEKTVCGTCITFLGVELDTVTMEARLPEDKLRDCRALLQSYVQHRRLKVKQLESLTGVLNFAC